MLAYHILFRHSVRCKSGLRNTSTGTAPIAMQNQRTDNCNCIVRPIQLQAVGPACPHGHLESYSRESFRKRDERSRVALNMWLFRHDHPLPWPV